MSVWLFVIGNLEQLVNACNAVRWSPLFMAAWQGHVDCVRLLLQSGADANPATLSHWVSVTARFSFCFDFLASLPMTDKLVSDSHHMPCVNRHTHTHNRLMAFGPGTTRVGRYLKKHSPTHTHPDHRTSFIIFHLQRSMASSLFILRAWQSSRTISLQVLFGLPLGLGPSTSYLAVNLILVHKSDFITWHVFNLQITALAHIKRVLQFLPSFVETLPA